MAKAKGIVKVTEGVRRAYLLFLSYYPSVFNVSYKTPASELGMAPERFNRICRGIADTVKKSELELLLENLLEKKKKELQGKIEKNERIPINTVTKEIINKFTEEKGSCRKAALTLGCNAHSYEKYNYNETKTIPRKIFDKIVLAIMEKYPIEWPTEKLRKAYPLKLFSPVPWKKDELKEKFLKKMNKAKSEEERKKLIERFAWKFLFRELRVNKKSDLYVYQNNKERWRYIAIDENIKKAFDLAKMALDNNEERLLERLNIKQKQIYQWFNKYNNTIPEYVVRELTNVINEKFGLSEIHKFFGFSDLNKLIGEARKKNKVPYCLKYNVEEVKDLIELYRNEVKKRNTALIKILDKTKERISRSSFYDYIELKKQEVPKSLIDAIHQQLNEWGYTINKNLTTVSERTFISNDLRQKLEEIVKMGKIEEIAKSLGTTKTLVYNIRKGITKTISLENLEKIENFYSSLK
ncbi:MAG: hypothetical protein N3G19_01885 [Candidatus Pacearchaeota archaeon]|nr:hypothetical protein [Candidatus Pacearchaeota archaeon]